jgi:hypothetical protein
MCRAQPGKNEHQRAGSRECGFNKSRPAETGITGHLRALCKKDDVIKALDLVDGQMLGGINSTRLMTKNERMYMGRGEEGVERVLLRY